MTDLTFIPKIGDGIVSVVKTIFSFISDFIIDMSGDMSDVVLLAVGILFAFMLFKYLFIKWNSDYPVYVIIGFLIYLIFKLSVGGC